MNRSDKYANILSRMIQCETVSVRHQEDLTKFEGFHEVLRELFPGVFQAMMSVELVNDGPVTIWLDTDELNKRNSKKALQ